MWDTEAEIEAEREYPVGMRVKFVGGTGRLDEATLTEGVVNGKPYVMVTDDGERVTHVPVFIPSMNHMARIVAGNIMEKS